MTDDVAEVRASRRAFLGKVGTTAASAIALPVVTALSEATNVYADDTGPQDGRERAQQAEEIRSAESR
jgi:hypothetical protein